MMRKLQFGLTILLFVLGVRAQTPVNQVFQYMQSGTCKNWADSSKTNATLYLWIPGNCIKVRGLVIMCSNVPEHRLVGHPAIRKACASNDLGIVWSTPSFMNFRKSVSADNKPLNMALDYKTSVDFLQQLLDSLARLSGYHEIATVPWLPMGESGHLLMVDALVEYKPERCIAGVWIKNNHLPPHNRQVPALILFGTSQEWGQDKVDIRTRWNDIGSEYEKILSERKLHPEWPLSYVIDGLSGHFDCSERLVKYMARYIDQVAKERLSDDGGPILKPVKINQGFVANLPVPGHNKHPANVLSVSETEISAFPWYFDKKSAVEAQAIANINWKAKTQLPGFWDGNGHVLPFDFNGITNIKKVDFEEDGITFKIHGKMLDCLPDNFVCSRDKLDKTMGKPVAEWLCGPLEPLGKNRFRISLDRTYGTSATYIGLRQKGNDTLRGIFEPAGIDLKTIRNSEGKSQTITFDKVPNIRFGEKSISLSARSDSELPVRFYVVAGPAIVKDNKLVITKIPPRTKFPVKVTVAAWQWGRDQEPKVKTAEVVKQTFSILK